MDSPPADELCCVGRDRFDLPAPTDSAVRFICIHFSKEMLPVCVDCRRCEGGYIFLLNRVVSETRKEKQPKTTKTNGIDAEKTIGCGVPSCVANWIREKNRPELFISAKCFCSCSVSLGWQPSKYRFLRDIGSPFSGSD
ncbi:hypothetical protein MUK42_36237 [Musa troglodytarum]|uniref:Uncharacterized protein n=1 Tax=Musa troglodytarum TaxID=320322 RepID=A0A9E7E9G3_9LILI|nr:hypothetical protein MUK42_36237 [Musa troglodytarum]